ncbi:hypothetical protein RFI_40213, partial [Reticulomyxa filosa]
TECAVITLFERMLTFSKQFSIQKKIYIYLCIYIVVYICTYIVNDWKGSEKDLCKYILALGKVDDKTAKNLIEQVQYFYDHILCLREWLESLYRTSDNFRFGQCSFTEFEIEINGKQIELVIHKSEEKKTKEVEICDWSDCNDDNNSPADDNYDDNASVVNMYAWDNVQVGDEFTYICQEGVSAMSNATQYIVLGEYIDFTNEKELNNNKIRNGWNIIDLLKADDEIEQNQLCEVFSKSCTFWKKKI